ncbi:MAG: L,D-transpeptidase family protein [Verrucomicrobiota bacterium]|nr:L,D-transpeptidase family protein [Verrucomicrobiota bacterium]
MKIIFSCLSILLLVAAAQSAPPKRSSPKPSVPPKATRAESGPKVMVALPNYDEVTATRLQIFLDNNDFGPGKIDGQMGEFFRKALIAYKRSHRLRETGVVDQWLLDQVPIPFTDYTIPPEADNFIGPVASKPSEQAKLNGLKYGSYLEFVAERFHSAEDYIRKLNPGRKMEDLKVGDTVKVPNVLPFKIEDLKEGFAKKDPAFANRKIYIDTKERFLLIYDKDQLVAEFPITPGSTTLPAPIGVWKILGIATLPVFRHDEGVLNHGEVTNNFFNLPAGPNNPVGILWMGLNKPHVGIHGTNNPETIGRAASHGCIRTANWDAARIRELVTVQNVVSIF